MRYALISDVHANLEALAAVSDAVQRLRRERPVQYWFLGDLLGYGPDPIECIRWLRYTARIQERWIAGNHDEEIVARGLCDEIAPSPLNGNTNHHAQRSWDLQIAALRDLVNESYWSWFQDQVLASTERVNNGVEERRSLVVEQCGNTILVFVHGEMQPRFRRSTYLRPDKLDLELNLEMAWQAHGGEDKTVCLMHGHTHMPLLARYEPATRSATCQTIRFGEPIALRAGCYAINPGSVGFPRDGDPRAAFAVLDPEGDEVTFHRVMYDVSKTVGKLERLGYPDRVIELLLSANGGVDLANYRAFYQAPDINDRVAIQQR